MKAVNLLPAQQRSQALSFSVSPPFAGLCGGLALVLVGTALYVSEHNRVDQREADLAELSLGVAHWNAVAQSFAPYTTREQDRSKQIAAVQQMINARYDWPNLMSEIAGLLPRDAELSSLQASSPNSTGSAAVTDGTSGTGSALQLTGCATSQDAVAATMVRLRRVTGVSDVTLTSSSGSSTGSGASSSGGGGCSLPVEFQMSLEFGTVLTQGAGSASTTSTTGAAS